MRATKALVLVGVIGFTLAAQGTIKQKLAQKGSVMAQTHDAIPGPVSTPSCGCGGGSPCDTAFKSLPFKSCDAMHAIDIASKLNANCNCTLPPLDTPDLGKSGNHTLNTTEVLLSSHQATALRAIPDTTSRTFDSESCCSCADSAHQAFQNETKIRRFGISGDICVTETVTIAEQGCADEASVGKSKHNGTHFDLYNDAGVGGNGTCYT